MDKKQRDDLRKHLAEMSLCTFHPPVYVKDVIDLLDVADKQEAENAQLRAVKVAAEELKKAHDCAWQAWAVVRMYRNERPRICTIEQWEDLARDLDDDIAACMLKLFATLKH